jgi:hypothetical protein
LDAFALQQQQQQDAEQDYNPVTFPRHDDDIASNVSSTASEMGTVINLGNHEERMREIDELARMMQEDDDDDGSDDHGDDRRNTSLMDETDHNLHIEPPPKLSNSLLHNDSGLDLPILESKSFDKPTLLPSNRSTATPVAALGFGYVHRHPYQNDDVLAKNMRNESAVNVSSDRSNEQNYSLEVHAGSVWQSTQKSPLRQTRPLTTSEMMTAALRRIGPTGSLVGGNGSHHRYRHDTSLSAPPTPRTPAPPQAPRVEDLLRSTLTPSRHPPTNDITKQPPPPSFALRSPGSGARFSLSQASRPRRHGGSAASRILYPQQQRVASNSTTTAGVTMSPRMALSQTFQLAQKCFSFDNTFPQEYSVDDFDDDDDNDNNNSQPTRMRRKLIIPSGYHQNATRLTPRVSPLEVASSFGGYNQAENNTPGRRGMLRHAQSWDVASGVGGNGTSSSHQHAVPFRRDAAPFLQHPSLRHPWGLHPIHDDTALTADAPPHISKEPQMFRGRIHSDFSPRKHSRHQIELETPQRIEIEREDALDILACLVEQGLADWNNKRRIDPKGSEKDNRDSHVADQKVATNTKKGTSPSSTPPASDIMDTDKEEKSNDATSSPGAGIDDDFRSESMIKSTMEEFQQWAKGPNDSGDDDCKNCSMNQDRKRRIAVLDELMKSHQYAVEMKRAAVSASTWLKSIGRGQQEVNRSSNGMNAEIHVDDVLLKENRVAFSLKQTSLGEMRQENGNLSESGAKKVEMLTLKAMLHNAQLQLSETRQANENLNEELSKCRAEIGRLKTMTRNEHVNRSILDDSHDTESSVTALSEAISKDAPVSPIARSRSFSDGEEEDCLLSVSMSNRVDNSIFQGMSNEEVKECVDEADQLDILVLKAALEKANDTIRTLHSKLHKEKAPNNDEVPTAPVVDVPEIETKASNSRKDAKVWTRSPEHRTVNVRMLDAENFVTDWDELRPSLPPPPDHGLRSPIVLAILEQWTPDRSLHNSLISWMEHVMKGNDLDDLPPLTISSLDHVVRDGFSMHVLPLLLRRADIHVAVQTRAHRQTTYDMAVTVSQKSDLMLGLDARVPLPPRTKQYVPPRHPSLLDRQDSTRASTADLWAQHFEPKISSAESVATSAATEPMANLPPVSLAPPSVPQTPKRSPHFSPQPSPMGYTSFAGQMRTRTFSGETTDERHQHHASQHVQPSSSIMGTLGGALSGLLSRNKYAASPGRNLPPQPYISNHASATTMGASLRAQLDLTSSPVPGQSSYQHHNVATGHERASNGNDAINLSAEEQQPYHRVVSAPPGRIGVTFVEFRGHAMVSDVAPDSPLSGWVFPSDVLIAVDEIPVSGMRVRDIVKILSNRKDRQRAMRVISSHAMNELSQGTLHEEDEEDA